MSPLCVSPTLFSSESTYQRTPIATPNLYGYNPFGFCPGEGSLPVPLVSPQPQPATATAWSAEHSSALYRVDGWGAPYFTINDNGNVAIRPHGAESLPSQEIDLTKIMKKVTDAKSHGGLGMRAPLIVRFPDILKHRLESLQSAFDNAVGRLGYESHYQGVYPVKCNQDRYVVENVVEFGSKFHFGLEAGSKPELLLAMASMCKASPEALLICNGYKDEEYVSLALNARLLGFNCVIVLEQEDELDVVLEASRRLSVRPVIGLRAKLRTKHGGHFGGTSGEKGKFGLTSTEIVSVLKKLKRLGMADCLKLLHFHIGSQIPTVDVLNDGATEAAFIYCELERMGADMKIIDIGGGLGIDYNGTKSESSDMSVAYTLEEYAFAVVRAVQAACRHKGVRCPVICSESGRALVSHHSLLLFDVLSVHEKSKAGTELLSELMAGMPAELVEDYRSIIIGENKICAEEMKSRCAELFKEGAISLEQLALADSVWDLMSPPPMSVCHINLSIFKSLPDCWAIGQVFPIMPIQRLNERPTVRAVLSDLTCDSDGKIHNFIDGEKGLAIHGQSDNPYYIGMFLGGAYQEALGGLHNLFGSPSVVHVRESDGPHCFSITRALPGQTSADVLRVMMHEPHQMFETLKSRIENAFIQSGFDGYDSETCNTAVSTLNTIAAAFDNIPYLSSSSSCCSSSASGASSSDEFDEEDLDLNLW